MIEFIVEDGTSKTDATSYATVAQYRQYWENRGEDYSATGKDDIESRLNIATEYIDSKYQFEGSVSSSLQSLQWPRTGAVDRNGYAIISTTIPQKLIDAVCYMAAQDDINVFVDGVTSVSYGPVSKTFSGQGKKFPVCDNLLKDIIMQGNRLARVN